MPRENQRILSIHEEDSAPSPRPAIRPDPIEGKSAQKKSMARHLESIRKRFTKAIDSHTESPATPSLIPSSRAKSEQRIYFENN